MVRVQQRQNIQRNDRGRVEQKKPTVTPVRTEPTKTKTQEKQPSKPTRESEEATRAAAQKNATVTQMRSQLEAKLGGATPSSRYYQVPDEKDFHPTTSETERTKDVKKQQEDAIAESLRTNKPVAFTSSEGKQIEVQAQKTDKGYDLTIDGRKTEVTFDPRYDEATRTRTLAKLADYHSQSPSIAKDGVVERFDIQAPNPASNVAAQYSADEKKVTFFGDRQVTESNFHHEVGHGVGYKLAGQNTSVPPGWDEATRLDGNEISGYGKQSYEEKSNQWIWNLRERFGDRDWATYRSDDFAESYQAYHEAKESGPEALEKFKQKYPNRAKYLEPYFRDELRDSPLPTQSDQPNQPTLA